MELTALRQLLAASARCAPIAMTIGFAAMADGMGIAIEEAQRDVRREFVGGFFGQLVSAVLWGLSAALGTWGDRRAAIATLLLGGFLIFPATWALLRLSGRKGAVAPGNPMGQLAMQVAFVLPLCLPLVGAATLYRANWFYPALMIALGAHYLPFWFLYGMRMFAVLAGMLVGAGLLVGLYRAQTFSLGGWITAGTLLLFAFIGGWLVRSEASQHLPLREAHGGEMGVPAPSRASGTADFEGRPR